MSYKQKEKEDKCCKIIRSKKDAKEFMQECLGLYLPSDKVLTSKFMRQIIGGEKEAIEIKDLKVSANVPQLSALRTDKIVKAFSTS